MRTTGSRIAVVCIVAIVSALALGQALAAAKKPAPCPTKVSQLSGCVKKVDAAKSSLVIDCNGMRHQVMVEKNAQIAMGNKTLKLKDLKVGTEVTVYGACSAKATTFKANKICECTAPRPKTKGKVK